MILHIDIETFSSVDIKKSGVYKYVEAKDFEILIIAYAFDTGPVKVIDLENGDKLHPEFSQALLNPKCEKKAHNAVFERLCFTKMGYATSIKDWSCSMVKAAYCGLPLSLDMLSKVLELKHAKLSSGTSLINYFSKPCTATKKNQGRVRNLPKHDFTKWGKYIEYCKRDVEAEREVDLKLSNYVIPNKEKDLYLLDQKINDRGVRIDSDFAKVAVNINSYSSEIFESKIKSLTNVDNPNSPAQLKKWIGEVLKKEITSLDKENTENLLESTSNEIVREVLRCRQKLSKSSIKKYIAMLNCVCSDGRGRGFVQFYGAYRTGRWAGRLVQFHNLVRNNLKDLDTARYAVSEGDYGLIQMLYGDVSNVLSQLIRTALVPSPGKVFAVVDFSSIEARIVAWLAQEYWRLKVFNTHGKIYEASAAAMFNVSIDSITKGSDLRSKGKVAELALGYQGGVGALKQMGGEEMGLLESEMAMLVFRWRLANPKIVKLWKNLESCAKRAVRLNDKSRILSENGHVSFSSDKDYLRVELPSGRELFYKDPEIRTKKVRKPNGDTWEAESITYMGMHQTKKQWCRLDTYGGKLTENITQAIARDILAESMLRLDANSYKIVMHVHDENITEIPNDGTASYHLDKITEIMSRPVSWAKDLPLDAEGYLTPYYKKD